MHCIQYTCTIITCTCTQCLHEISTCRSMLRFSLMLPVHNNASLYKHTLAICYTPVLAGVWHGNYRFAGVFSLFCLILLSPHTSVLIDFV